MSESTLPSAPGHPYLSWTALLLRAILNNMDMELFYPWPRLPINVLWQRYGTLHKTMPWLLTWNQSSSESELWPPGIWDSSWLWAWNISQTYLLLICGSCPARSLTLPISKDLVNHFTGWTKTFLHLFIHFGSVVQPFSSYILPCPDLCQVSTVWL